MIKALLLYPFSKAAKFYWHYLVAFEYTNFLNEDLLNKEEILQSRFKHSRDAFEAEDLFNRMLVDRRKIVIEKHLAKMREIDPKSPFVSEIENLYLNIPKKEVPDTQISAKIKAHYPQKNIVQLKKEGQL